LLLYRKRIRKGFRKKKMMTFVDIFVGVEPIEEPEPSRRGMD